MKNYHIPVMAKEAISFLNLKPKNWYVDCNLGGGGHTKLILEKGANVLGIDLDPDSIAEVSQKNQLKIKNQNLILVQDNFSNIDQIIQNHNLTISGILYDLGVSSHQLETTERGFSFNMGGPLDMRMDPSQGIPAKDLINGLHEKELAELFYKLGEENFSKPIAKKIIEVRKIHTIDTTDDLAKIITSVRKKSSTDRTHPATRIFQALRIAVNDELNSLKQSLPKAFEILKPGGRIVVISFHSLEDRIVKNFFADLVSQNQAKSITKKPISPTEQEVMSNPRSRSGKLRVIEKI